jgi:hypothetical protein
MGKCILTGVEVTDSNDSKAHIIASALGGRLKPKGILSRDGNNVLDRKVDNIHIKAMLPYMNRLNGSRDRGGAPALIPATDNNGKRYLVGADEVKPLDYEYNVKMVDGKLEGTIKAPTMKQAKDLLGKAKAEFNLSSDQINEVLAQAQVIQEEPGPLTSDIKAGPAVEFPSTFTMAALFCANYGLPVRSDFVSYISSFDEKTDPRPLPADTFYFIHEKQWFNLDAEMGHCLIFFGDPIRQKGIFFSQLFNMLGIAVLMPFTGNEEVLHTYGVDILKGLDVSVSVDSAALLALEWKETHKLGEPELYKINEIRGNALMRLAGARGFAKAQDAIWAKHQHGKDINSAMTREERTAVYKDLCQLLQQHQLTPAAHEENLRGLKLLFEELGGVDC